MKLNLKNLENKEWMLNKAIEIDGVEYNFEWWSPENPTKSKILKAKTASELAKKINKEFKKK